MSGTPSGAQNDAALAAPQPGAALAPEKSMVVVAGNLFGLGGGMRDHKISAAVGGDGKPLGANMTVAEAEVEVYKNPELKNALVWQDEKTKEWKVLKAGVKDYPPIKGAQEEHAFCAAHKEYAKFRDPAYLNQMLKDSCKHLQTHLSTGYPADAPPLMDTIASLQAGALTIHQGNSQEENDRRAVVAQKFQAAVKPSLSKLTDDPFVAPEIPGKGVHLAFACAPMCSFNAFGVGTKVAQEDLPAADYQKRISHTYEALDKKREELKIAPQNVIPTAVGGGLYAGALKPGEGSQEQHDLQDARIAASSTAYADAKFKNKSPTDIGATVAALAAGQSPAEAAKAVKPVAPVQPAHALPQQGEGIKMPAGMGKKLGSDEEAKDGVHQEQAAGLTPQGQVHDHSQKSMGHFSVVDSDGTALNRATYDYLQQKQGHKLAKEDVYQEYAGH